MAAQDLSLATGLGQASGPVTEAHSVLPHLLQLPTRSLPFTLTHFPDAPPVQFSYPLLCTSVHSTP